MTTQEALELYEKKFNCEQFGTGQLCSQYNACEGCPNNYDSSAFSDAENIAFDALKRLTPQKVLISKRNYIYFCPRCGFAEIEDCRPVRYCKNCGQAIEIEEY